MNNQLPPPVPRNIYRFNQNQQPILVHNSVFGARRINAPQQYGQAVQFEYDEISAKNEVYRHLGISKEILKENRLAAALNNPTAYRNQRMDAKIMYADQAYDEFKRVYEDLLNRGYDSIDAEKKAKNAMDQYWKLKQKVIEKDFPPDIDKKVLKKMI